MHGRADEVLDGLDVCTAAVGEKVYMYELMDGNAECIPSSLQLSRSVNGRARCGSVVRGGRERAHWLTPRRTRPRVRNSWTHNSFRIDCYGCPSRVSSCAPAIYLTSILSPKAECASTSVVAAHAGKTRSPSPPALVCLALPPHLHLSARTAACDVRAAILFDFV